MIITAVIQITVTRSTRLVQSMAREELLVEAVSIELLKSVGQQVEQRTKLHTGDRKLA